MNNNDTLSILDKQKEVYLPSLTYCVLRIYFDHKQKKFKFSLNNYFGSYIFLADGTVDIFFDGLKQTVLNGHNCQTLVCHSNSGKNFSSNFYDNDFEVLRREIKSLHNLESVAISIV